MHDGSHKYVGLKKKNRTEKKLTFAVLHVDLVECIHRNRLSSIVKQGQVFECVYVLSLIQAISFSLGYESANLRL